jgi:hypothetical protein
LLLYCTISSAVACGKKSASLAINLFKLSALPSPNVLKSVLNEFLDPGNLLTPVVTPNLGLIPKPFNVLKIFCS